ncbi:MAG TPA: P1 family peptidase [Chloroflexota bacterium]|nr:P1 family peptidase [Chloroflexota bacterium]
MLSNDQLALVPRIPEGGPTLELDFPGLEIGVAEYDEGPTGCTVFHFPGGPRPCAVDVRGGSPAWVGDYGRCDAVCLAGGSAYGLEAAAGVAAELLARRGYSTEWGQIALVSGAIVFDYRVRDNAVYPDKALGRAALRAARPGRFPLGPRGGGRAATVGKLFRDALRGEPAGQGGAVGAIGATRVAVFTVVNAVGAVVDRQGRVVRGYVDPATGQRVQLADALARLGATTPEPPPGNTTISLVVTNLRLGTWELRQLGRQVHASMARALQPFHALTDGDVMFAVSTEEVEDPDLPVSVLGAVAGEVAWDAVLSCWAEG